MKYFEDDMDELFNKAGRQYPLKTDPKDWDNIRAALVNEQGAAVAGKARSSYRRYLPLLLLLLIPAVYVFLDKENVKSAEQATTNDDSKGLVSAGAPDSRIIPDTRTSDNKITTPAGESLQNESAGVSQNENTIAANDNREKASDGKAGNENGRISPNEGNLSVKDITYPADQHESLNKTAVPFSVGGNISKRSENISGTKVKVDIASNTVYDLSETIKRTVSARTLVTPNESVSVPNSDKKNKHKSGLYYGITAAPDASTIKGQKVEGIGYSAGAIVGYNINDRWSIEGGVLWSNKKYFTKGKYFSKQGAQIPDYINVHWLDGGCEMLEFPLSARYSFTSKRNTFFAGLGLTSYLMKTEDYTYLAEQGASNVTYEGYRSYDRSGDHLFANVQLSAGYKFALTPKFNVRIEPYLKAPLKKVGIGKMPITSTGLYLSFTRDLR